MSGEPITMYRDGYDEPVPAINVKMTTGLGRQVGDKIDRVNEEYMPTDELADMAFEATRETFWIDATTIAHQRGYSGVFALGRSGGWLVPFRQSGRRFMYNAYPGCGGPNGSYSEGHPTFPDVEHDASERERFRAFERRITALFLEMPDQYRSVLESMLEPDGDEG